ncbi:MAG TPA: YiiD C-terminal domain-containing protein [Desulfobacteria bacterium]|nr:YiiD C-terminal domain-containing protein [Desulfobacteria bacterium]
MDNVADMNEKEFEEFLHRRIPITKDMEFNVEEFKTTKVRIGAKLLPNINHKSTAFGGSINSLTTMCGWALVFSNIKTLDPNAHIVIQKSSIAYLKPIDKDFTAECELIDETVRDNFLEMYEQQGKARMEVRVFIRDGEKILAEFCGYYVAFK